MPPQRSQAKHWCFTLNNYTEEDVVRLQALGGEVDYLIAGKEVGTNGTPHLQGLVSFSQRKRLAQVKALLGAKPHLEVCRNLDAADEYC